MNKIAIFCSNLEYPARKYIYDISEVFPAIQFLILYPSHLQAHKNLSCADKRTSQDINTRNDRRYPGKLYEWDSIQRLPNLSHADFKDWHQDEIARSISLFKPDLGLLLSPEIPGSSYYDIPTLGTIRLQVGKPSPYRDIPTGFWELIMVKKTFTAPFTRSIKIVFLVIFYWIHQSQYPDTPQQCHYICSQMKLVFHYLKRPFDY